MSAPKIIVAFLVIVSVVDASDPVCWSWMYLGHDYYPEFVITGNKTVNVTVDLYKVEVRARILGHLVKS